ncbi:MAG: hypothetical protein ACYDHX_11485 [Methanothrix sp.]
MLSEPLIQRTARQEPGNSASWGPLSGCACGLAGYCRSPAWSCRSCEDVAWAARLAGRNPVEQGWPSGRGSLGRCGTSDRDTPGPFTSDFSEDFQ